LRPHINSIWILLSCLCGAPSLTRGRVCLLSITVSNNCPPSSFFLHFLFLSILHVTTLTAWYKISCYSRPHADLKDFSPVIFQPDVKPSVSRKHA
jgi:hypothetical protein